MRLNNFWKNSLLIVSILIGHNSFSSDHLWVYFQDKCNLDNDYFSANVCQEYLDSMEKNGVHIKGTSKWLNAACISACDTTKLIDFSFISHIEPLKDYRIEKESISSEEFRYGNGDWQIGMMKLDQYHELGYSGSGVRLAVFDGGFYKVDSFSFFQSLWDNNQIVASRDFVTNDTLNWRESAHGMQVLSLMALNYPDSIVGASPSADYVLARTENVSSEKHIEELNWLRALEWADSIGVDIIHSSLGYSVFDSLQGNYTYQDMDGQSTIVTQAAELAASRGIFITNSAGNAGNTPWLHITAPCDGPNVLCVGAVDSFKLITEFSSRGPSSDGRIKPDVAAMGGSNTVPSRLGLLRTGSGTSFSGPLVAGLVACLKSAHPQSSNKQIFEAILLSSDRYNEPDSLYGHGIPDALKADSILRSWPVTSIELEQKLEISVYPNPSREIIKISTEPGAKFQLINTQGAVTKEGSFHNWINFLDIKDLRDGVYFLKVSHQSKQSTLRLIVN